MKLILAIAGLGFAGGTTFTLALLRGGRCEPPPRPPASAASHVCITPRAFDWQRTETP